MGDEDNGNYLAFLERHPEIIAAEMATWPTPDPPGGDQLAA